MHAINLQASIFECDGRQGSIPGSGLFEAFQVVSAHHLNAVSAELGALLHQIGPSHVQGFHGNINTQEVDIAGPIPAEKTGIWV